MCDDHSGVLVEIQTASNRGPDGNKRAIDACIAPLVKVLNDNGFATKASCCGHGKRPGTIILMDGREIAILPDFETGRRLDKLIDDGALDAAQPGIARTLEWLCRYVTVLERDRTPEQLDAAVEDANQMEVPSG